MTENMVIFGDFVYSHVNTMYVCNLSTKFLVTVNYFLEQIDTHSPCPKGTFVPRSKISLTSMAYSSPIYSRQKPLKCFKSVFISKRGKDLKQRKWPGGKKSRKTQSGKTNCNTLL